MKKFEDDQFIIVWFSEEYESIDTETVNRKKEAIKMAKEVIETELKKVKKKHPYDYMKHIIKGARVYDLLNRSKFFVYLELKGDGNIIISNELLNSEFNMS